jgi:hypothetical protein
VSPLRCNPNCINQRGVFTAKLLRLAEHVTLFARLRISLCAWSWLDDRKDYVVRDGDVMLFRFAN